MNQTHYSNQDVTLDIILKIHYMFVHVKAIRVCESKALYYGTRCMTQVMSHDINKGLELS